MRDPAATDPIVTDGLNGAPARDMTADDAMMITTLLAGANGDYYSVEHTIAQGAEQGSIVPGNDPFTFASWNNWQPSSEGIARTSPSSMR